MERTVWAVRNVTSGTSVSNRAERPSKTTPNLEGLPRQWTTIMFRKSPNCPWSCRRSRNLKKLVSPDFDRKTEDASCCRKTCAASADASLLIHEFWRSMRRPFYPDALLSRFGPCGLFIVLEVEILPKMSPISDGRGDRKKIDTGPSRRPAKHLPEMEKTLEEVCQEWRGVLWRWQVWLSCKWSNKFKKICFFMDCPRTIDLVRQAQYGHILLKYSYSHLIKTIPKLWVSLQIYIYRFQVIWLRLSAFWCWAPAMKILPNHLSFCALLLPSFRCIREMIYSSILMLWARDKFYLAKMIC